MPAGLGLALVSSSPDPEEDPCARLGHAEGGPAPAGIFSHGADGRFAMSTPVRPVPDDR
jgi:hypothetical protein